MLLLSYSLNALLFTIFSEVLGGELASVSRTVSDGPDIVAILMWKAAELSVAWGCGFDGESFSLVSQAAAQ